MPNITMTNKKLGNDFENRFVEILSQEGYWCHLFAQSQAGQPADVIAVRNGKAYLIDCKVCSTRGFALSRMEENQDLSMSLWKSNGNGEGWFALKIGEEIVMISHFSIKALMREKSVLNLTDIREYGVKLERWLKKCM